MPNTNWSDSRTFRHLFCWAVLALLAAASTDCAAQPIGGNLDGIPFASENLSGTDYEAALLSLLFLALAIAVPLFGFMNARGRGEAYWAIGAVSLCAGVWVLAQSALRNFLVPSAAFWKFSAMLAVFFLPAAVCSFAVRLIAYNSNGAALFLTMAKLHILFAVLAMFVVATDLLPLAVAFSLFYILLAVTIGTLFYYGTIAISAGKTSAMIFVLGLALNLLTALAALGNGRAGFALPLRHLLHWGLLAFIGGMTAIAQYGCRQDAFVAGNADEPPPAIPADGTPEERPVPAIPSRRDRKYGGARYHEAPLPQPPGDIPPEPREMPPAPRETPVQPEEISAGQREIPVAPPDTLLMPAPPPSVPPAPAQQPPPAREVTLPTRVSPPSVTPPVPDALTEKIREFAHEINTPLGAGMLAASHLEQQVQKLNVLFKQDHLRKSDLEQHIDNYQKAAEIILTNFRTAAELTKNLRASSRESDEKQVLDLKKFVEETLLRLSPKIQEAGHQVHFRCVDDLVILALPRAISQILTNLIVNSLVHAYAPGVKGILTIDISYENGTVDMRYGDDGKGMEREILRQIFTPHFTTNEQNGSTGLGLAIVETEVNKLGGTIECVSMPGVGTIFTVRFPAERK